MGNEVKRQVKGNERGRRKVDVIPRFLMRNLNMQYMSSKKY